MRAISLPEFFRLHFGGVQVRSLYLTIPGAELGRIIAARETETGTLFTLARAACAIPELGSEGSLAEIETSLRAQFSGLYKNVLVTLPWVRATQTDPAAFVQEFHTRFSRTTETITPDLDLAWMRAAPREYIYALLRILRRDPHEIYGSPNPDQADISQADPALGLVLAPPKVLTPRLGEVPAVLFYALASI